MPAKWERMAKHVTASEIKRGMPRKRAKQVGYATATARLGRGRTKR